MLSFLDRSGEGEQLSYFKASVTVRRPRKGLKARSGYQGTSRVEAEAAQGLTSWGRWLLKSLWRAEGSAFRSLVRSWWL